MAEQRLAIGGEPLAAIDDFRRQAVPLRKTQLRDEPLLTPEVEPVVRFAIGLWRGADVVVAGPSEVRLRQPVLRGERGAQRGGTARVDRYEIEPLEHQPCALAVV